MLLEKLYRYYEHAVSKAVPFGEHGPSEFFSGPEELLRRQENEARKRMVMPIAPDTELFIEEWLSKTYEKKEFCDTSGLYGAEQNSGTGADPDTRNGVETGPDRSPGKHSGAISPLLKICTNYVP